ncbi:hypothetical protein PZA11_005429 [Diplocarpon coronariae]|uniref:Vacuolar membrane protein n=1 Tax=Diplocarpon coronariae TaxID=2795749 RepID=A0A218ZBH2_9HELO|nr:hypothetical protein JHW43_000157 [Diplocarpon mali]OWP04940.1 hypothetical protein B2J93_6986 [Marssonina coronariae]
MHPPPGLELSSENASATSTLLSAAVATAVALSPTTTSASSPHDSPPKNGECELLGPFAILVQGALGLCALLALVFKRWRERPQRPVKIWFFDVSKQVVGSVLVHMANLLMSMVSSGKFSVKLDPSTVASRMADEQEKYKPNPCSFYLLNLAIDTTIGIPILIFLLRILTSLFLLTPVGVPAESIASGNYGSPPRAWWWLKQSIIYFLGLLGMKICVLIIFLVLPWISRVGDWALRWTEGDEALQVIFVMLIFPVIMNATQYYIIDSFIKNQKPAGHELVPGEDGAGDTSEDYAEGSSSGMDSSDDSDEGDEEIKTKVPAEVIRTRERRQGGSSMGKPLQTGSTDYDPLFDGESSPTVVGSASTSERDPLALKEASKDEGVSG